MPSMGMAECDEANKVGKGHKRYINANKSRCKVKRYRMMKTQRDRNASPTYTKRRPLTEKTLVKISRVHYSHRPRDRVLVWCSSETTEELGERPV